MKPVLALFAALALAGCSETQFADAIGAGKNSPDETVVARGHALSMPPDLQLPPPGSGPDSAAYAEAAPAPETKAAALPAPGDAAPATAAAPGPATASAPVQDIYAHYGIAKTNPDGTPKPKTQLYKELRAAQLAEKRKTNPNYGTIFNIGDLFSDG